MKKVGFLILLMILVGCQNDSSIVSSVPDNLSGRSEETKNNAHKKFESTQKSAEAGDVEAEYNLGRMYYHGEGIGNDLKQALEWYEKAANHGHKDAQVNVAKMYANAEGSARNNEKSISWYVQAAEQGVISAQIALANVYYKGEVVDRDFKIALDWFMKAAEQGDSDAQYMLGYMYSNGEGTEKNMQQSLDWMTKSAEKNNPIAQRDLGFMYGLGQGIEKNPAKAFEWFSKAAAQNRSDAEFMLFSYYLHGYESVVEKDISLALDYLQKAASSDHMIAEVTLAEFTLFGGAGLQPSIPEAMKWYRKASEHTDEDVYERIYSLIPMIKGSNPQYAKTKLQYLESAIHQPHSAIETYEANAARFDRDFKGKTFVAHGLFQDLNRCTIGDCYFMTAKVQDADVNCVVNDKRTLDALIDLNEGQPIYIDGKIDDVTFRKLNLESCMIMKTGVM